MGRALASTLDLVVAVVRVCLAIGQFYSGLKPQVILVEFFRILHKSANNANQVLLTYYLRSLRTKIFFYESRDLSELNGQGPSQYA